VSQCVFTNLILATHRKSTLHMNTTKVTLREKSISKGRKSLYLDFYPAILNPDTGKRTRRQFLKMYILEKPRGPIEKQHNKETLALAQSVRAKYVLDLQAESFGLTSDRKKNKDFLDYFYKMTLLKYDSLGNYGNWKACYELLLEFRPDGMTFGELDVESINQFRAFILAKTKLKTNTKASYFNKFLAAIKQAYKENIIPDNLAKHVDRIKEEETHREFLLIDEIQKLAKANCESPVHKSAFLFSVFTGLRFSDIQNLKWKDIKGNKEEGYYIRFRQQKTKGLEKIDLGKPALKIIGPLQKGANHVFEGLEYSAWHNKKITKWVLDAGIDKKITFHCARHTFATLQLSEGTDIYTLSKLLGHKELKTTEVYANLVDSKKTEAIHKLDNIEI